MLGPTGPVCQGFKYWSNPSNPTSGYIEWQVNGSPTAQMGALAVGPDQDPMVRSGVGQRIIPVEPMVRKYYFLFPDNFCVWQS
jgi:hypothetical protein